MAIELVKGLITYLKKYRESRFAKMIVNSELIENEIKIECVFVQKRQL